MRKNLINLIRNTTSITWLILAITTLVIVINTTVACGQGLTIKKNGTRTIYLIRHGQYNHEDKRDPDIGKSLVPLGIEQARLITKRLKSMPVTMNSLISSTMTRARETAMIINKEFPELKLQQSRIIRECTPPTWREDIMEREDDENLEECTDQLEKAFAKYFIPSPDNKDRHDIIVCHGNVIRFFVTRVLKVDSMSWLQMTASNCGLTVVQIKPGSSMKLLSFNDTGHLLPKLKQ